MTHHPDFGMSLEQIREKYDTEESAHQHSFFTYDDWRTDVYDCNTKRGYWDWVLYNIETAEFTPEYEEE
jgi:hypothetical protein